MNIFFLFFQMIIGLIPFIAYTDNEIDEPSDWSYLLLLDVYEANFNTLGFNLKIDGTEG